jgi:hypothetical protein
MLRNRRAEQAEGFHLLDHRFGVFVVLFELVCVRTHVAREPPR